MFNSLHPEVADTLSLARGDGKPYYRGKCYKHGSTILATLDQTCPKCQAANALRRRRENRVFNRQRELFFECKQRAKKRNIPFSLDLTFFRGIIPESCPVFGTPFTYGKSKWTSPSIDKLDNKKGYTKKNTRVISTRANIMKNDGTPLEHLQITIWQLKEQGLSSKQIASFIQEAVDASFT